MNNRNFKYNTLNTRLNQYSSVKSNYSSGFLKYRIELFLKDNFVQRMIVASEQMVDL
jgi:hypothetical protein